MKKLCIFCMKSHAKKPKLCEAKSRVMSAYMNAAGKGAEWKVFAAIHQGALDLDGEAFRLLEKQNTADLIARRRQRAKGPRKR